MRQHIFIFLIALGLTGCAPVNREQLVKEVLSKDPEFSSVLEKHKELSSRIQTYEHELALKRSTVEKTIAQLRKDLAVAAANVRMKIEEVKKRMEPDQKRLELALSMAVAELRAKGEQRAILGRKIAEFKKTVQGSTSTLSGKALAEQQAKIEALLQDTARLDQERQMLKERVRLLKIELLLIKL